MENHLQDGRRQGMTPGGNEGCHRLLRQTDDAAGLVALGATGA
jgi:hypothetical protein